MSLESELKDKLNPEQYRAVTTLEGAILIIAGAGSGKTRVITYRIANMLEKGIPQSAILALTFTNKAAKEMEERIKDLTGKKLQNLTVSTFHAFGVQILRQEIEALGFRQNFSIYDETDKKSLIKETGRELKYTADALDLYKISVLFSDIKTGRKNWESENDMYRQLYEEYQKGLKLYNAVDFDDLIVLPIKLFHEHPEILEKYKNRYKYIMVDEFQDTSHQQYEFMHLLSDKNIAVVGDDDQSIYSWRGADYQNIVNFEKDFDVTEIRLEQNYRSTGTILAAANGVIKHNTNRKDKELWSGNGDGKPIEVFMPENEAAEAEFIAEGILGICTDENRNYDDFGVLIRANTQSRAIEEAFLENNIPYTMSGGTSFFERKEIKDIISYLRVIANHDDDINLLRIINTPRRGIGRVTIEAISEVAKRMDLSLWEAIQALFTATEEECPVSESTLEDLKAFTDIIENAKSMLGGKGLSKKVRQLVDDIKYFDYLIGENPKSEKSARFKFMNIESLIKSMEQWENNPNYEDTSLYAYLNRITLLSRDDMDDEQDKGKVNLMTVHASKGLEFQVVFIAGAEEGLMPHAHAVEEGGDAAVEEERRLFYVAVTRAQKRLLISSCKFRRKMGGSIECQPSRFLDEIPPNLVQYHEPSKEVEKEKAHELLQNMLKNFSKPRVPKL
ncbi:MAG: 3'-5' exonuclease [Treponema sp.]|nr:UvrD-helicase domain-containing protein [Spirochaetia bacterium]MDD7581241.1 3'-5' exonuclease [Treponema sp.]MDY4129797.1 3'-5' exonuclease [Treponema sp.]MDY5837208.1 3'-5' exonuclease [Treponema sp.]